ncbi:MAG: hypothetical protein IJZ77_02745 [Bacilli bacterium]|nr:hypothetical protein [Bacilli bacterium]
MASLTLYPPIVESSMPAFVANKNAVCRVYFSLSQFNTRNHFKNAQVSVVKQDSGLSVVNRTDGEHYRATGIILNVPVYQTDQENLWYIEILNEDIGYQTVQGWTIGWFYKIQIRLSNITYNGECGQAAWINNNSQYFSEWSTATLVKAIGEVGIQIPVLGFDSQVKEDNVESASLAISTLDIHGTYTCEDSSEILHSYKIELYKEEELIESSGIMYTNQYVNSNEFTYICKTDLADSEDIPYTLYFHYKTVNDYEATEVITFTVLQTLIGEVQVELKIYGETEVENDIEAATTIALEEDEGRVGIKFKEIGEEKRYSGNLCIRRTDSKSNYKIWYDIAVIVAIDQLISEIPIYYDYTIESGVGYKYGVQAINKDGSRGTLNSIDKIIIRSFEYSYLLGQNNQQLKLMFNSNMNTFKPVRNDSKNDTIGSAFPFVSRNGATKYKTFPITGLISYNMDDFNLFLPANFFKGRAEDLYTKEREFRDVVLNFLLDGKPKLFKSPTEGNVIVRLTDVSCTPEQALGRLIYNFSATAYEIAEPTMENYLKYDFYYIAPYEKDFSTSSYKICQLQQKFTLTDNICELIKNKYNIETAVANHIQKVSKIIGLKITIEDDPLRVKNNVNQLVIGNNIQFNDKIITIYGTTRIYEFDPEVVLTTSDKLYFLGDEQGLVTEINATIDFICEIVTTAESGKKEIATTRVLRGVGQLFKNVSPNESLYYDLYYKYYIEWEQEYRRLNRLWSIEIEANPGTVFRIKDSLDSNAQYHEVNETGILRFSELSNIIDILYYGTRKPTGEIDTTVNADVNINYLYYLLKGTYK